MGGLTGPAGAAGRRRRAVLCGHRGDVPGARSLLGDPDPSVRAAALGALARLDALSRTELAAALADRDPRVRRRGCEVAVGAETVDLSSLLSDPDPGVVEAAVWALGERGPAAASAVPELCRVATSHDDPVCREAAVAALGAVGDPSALPAVLAVTRDTPAVRRRAVVALAAFSGPEVEAALRRALEDRDWQTRQAAEDLLDPER